MVAAILELNSYKNHTPESLKKTLSVHHFFEKYYKALLDSDASQAIYNEMDIIRDQTRKE